MSWFKTHKGFSVKTGQTVEQVVNELVKAHARQVLSSGVADLTDNSGGSASGSGTSASPWTITAASTSLANVADGGTTLASSATTSSALSTVVDAVGELFAKANAYLAKLNLTPVTNNGGGAAPDGTIGAITVATTAATTGAQATNVNADVAALNTAIYNVAVITNQILHAVEMVEVVVYKDTIESTIAALSTAAGVDANPGIAKTAMDAVLVQLANNVATLAAALNAVNAGLTSTFVTAVK